MFVGYEQIAAGPAVQTADDLTIPGNATGVLIQVDTNNIRYTMDGATDPTAAGIGMLFVVNEAPQFFTIDDLLRIRFIQVAAGVGNMNLHYTAGRNI